MKTLVFIALLAVVTVIYGLNEQRLRKFYDNINKCREEGLDDTLNAEVALCAVAKDGKILDAKGEVIRETSNKVIRDFISDASRREKAQNIYNKCHDEAENSGVTGLEQTTKIALCTWPIIYLFDKL